MPPTKIESFLFNGENHAHLVTGCELNDRNLGMTFSPLDKPEALDNQFKAIFPEAVITAMDQQEIERDGWPLVIIGLDSYSIGKRWRFVLNCGSVEWIWQSSWPYIVTPERSSKK